MKIAIVDPLGIHYDGTTLQKRGLGGSETAVIRMAEELTKLGINVDIYNDCHSGDACPANYDGVNYFPILNARTVVLKAPYDVVVVTRSVLPFKENWSILLNTKHKILWMHDTFSDGDESLEELVVNGEIDEIFTLSDWHTSYITSCNHGNQRHFDVLKKHIFQTRNGIGHMSNRWVDPSAKDPNLFVFNASVTKGMVPLVKKIWPKVLDKAPKAKLKVVGGYYRMNNGEPDQQELDWREMVKDHPEIEFTGVIPQAEISDILRAASYFVYPCDFPETFGISTLEALYHKVPVITCNFGALEQTAIDIASYKIPYPVVPNFMNASWLNEEEQVDKFVELILEAYDQSSDGRLIHQQKMHACSQVRNICSWRSVALQWYSHIHYKLGVPVPLEITKATSKINAEVNKVFGKRWKNPGEVDSISQPPYNKIDVITPCYNAEKWIGKCIESVAAQNYSNYRMWIVDDASTDNTYREAVNCVARLPENLRKNFIIKQNDENVGALANQIGVLEGRGDSIAMLLDGDDWLVNDPDIFNYYNNLYNDGAEFTYGSCWSVVDGIPLISQEYPPEIKQTKQYRQYQFPWNMPYTHLRTFDSTLFIGLIHQHGYHPFKDADGNYYRAGGDGALFYNVLEMADPEKVICVPHIHYVYNDAHDKNDYKINGDEQTKNAERIRNMTNGETTKKILIAVPTNKGLENETAKSLINLNVPGGYETHFEYFYGYAIDQVRNLVATWSTNYDYIFFVDSDISFGSDTLGRLLKADKDIVSGVYRQRLDNGDIELYDKNYRRILYGGFDANLLEIGACGMGCCLIKTEVFKGTNYPHFKYEMTDALTIKLSEDVYFCKKAREAGFTVWADLTLTCGHHGNKNYAIADLDTDNSDPIRERLSDLTDQDLLPASHADFLHKLSDTFLWSPKVIYDIGACTLHWTKKAKEVWPEAEFVLFDAVDELEFLYEGYKHHIGVLSDSDGTDVIFNQSLEHPAGNSYYDENPKFSPNADKIWTEDNKVTKKTQTLDSVVGRSNFPLPTLIKMDVQGAELDILKGAEKVLAHAELLILEIQNEEYNIGGAKRDEIVNWLKARGWSIHTSEFSKNGVDSDWCFYKTGYAQ